MTAFTGLECAELPVPQGRSAGCSPEPCGATRGGLRYVTLRENYKLAGEAGGEFGYPVGPVLLAHPAGPF